MSHSPELGPTHMAPGPDEQQLFEEFKFLKLNVMKELREIDP